jgi:hypothetical protein
VLKVSDMLKNK